MLHTEFKLYIHKNEINPALEEVALGGGEEPELKGDFAECLKITGFQNF